MMKKIIKYTFLALVGSVAISSCSGFLDQEPSGSVPSSSALATYNDASTALAGAYDAIQGNSTYRQYYGANMLFHGDVQGDLIQAFEQGKRSSSLYEMRWNYENAPATWSIPYRVISRSNSIIKAVNDGVVKDGTAEQLNNLKGQAMFLRAIAHFDLCRLYSLPYTVDPSSPGIPMILEPFTGASILEVQSDRSTVAKVYGFLVIELKEAATLIANNEKSYGYANSWAAKALLSRVYLYMGDNTNALAVAEDIIENSPYTLWTNIEYSTVWSKSQTSELIFEIVNYDSNDWVDREAIGYLYDEDGYADMVATPKLVQYFKDNPNDIRAKLLLPATTFSQFGTDNVFINKYPGRTGFDDVRVNNIPLLRLSEVYLTAAEAAQKLASPKADGYINEIAKRNVGKLYANVTLDEILFERAIEMFGEGQRKFDLLRNNKTIDRTSRWEPYILEAASVKFDVNYYRAILPIPKSEMDANPSLKDAQNPGY